MDATVSQGNESSNKSLIDLRDDHSLAPMESNQQKSVEKGTDYEKTGIATDDFEHILVDNPSCATETPSAMNNLENFMTEFSSDIKTSNVDKLSSTKDFMEHEKQFQEHHHIGHEVFDSGDSQHKEGNKTVYQDIKKNLHEDNEKFISSEDLRADFKDEKQTDSALEQSQKVNSDEKQISSNETTTEVEQLPPQESLSFMEQSHQTDTTKTTPKDEVASQNVQMITAEEIFCRYGLDAWFKPDRLHPKVESLIYWRDAKKTGVLFGVGLTILLAISCYSVISVFAYVSLITLIGTSSFRIYKDILGAVQKTSDGHPFKQYLEEDVKLSQEKVQNVINVGVAHLNATVLELRRLFLVENLVDSLKFGFILWTCTYIGSWFNGMTIVILAFVALFTLPKVYENNKQSIDTYIDLVRSKFLEITDKVKAAIPIGKKQESDKEK